MVVAAVTGAKPQEGALERPTWSGETPVSRLVGALIAFKPLYSLMKLASREVIIRYLIVNTVAVVVDMVMKE